MKSALRWSHEAERQSSEEDFLNAGYINVFKVKITQVDFP